MVQAPSTLAHVLFPLKRASHFCPLEVTISAFSLTVSSRCCVSDKVGTLEASLEGLGLSFLTCFSCFAQCALNSLDWPSPNTSSYSQLPDPPNWKLAENCQLIFSPFSPPLFFFQCSWCQNVICFAPVPEVFVFLYFHPMLASLLAAESSAAGVLSCWYLCHLQMLWVNYTMFLPSGEASLWSWASCGSCTCAEHHRAGWTLRWILPKTSWGVLNPMMWWDPWTLSIW